MSQDLESTVPVKRVVEAALLAAAQPLTPLQLVQLFDDSEQVDHAVISRVLADLAEDAADRGIELIEVSSGFRFQVRAELHPWIARLWTERQSRYSRAMLETLALIAYRQPITRGEIEQIRGVSVSTQIIKTLEEREWIRVLGYRDVPGRPALLGTTRIFLDYFSLKSLDELPPLAAIRDFEAIDPELPFDGGGIRGLTQAAAAFGAAADDEDSDRDHDEQQSVASPPDGDSPPHDPPQPIATEDPDPDGPDGNDPDPAVENNS